jgi:DNA modification methylase
MINQVIYGNCLDYINNITQKVDLIILDPNYEDWEFLLLKEKIIEKCLKVLKKTGSIICFTKQPYDFLLRNEIHHLFKQEIIWSYPNSEFVHRTYALNNFQKVYWLTPNKKEHYFDRTNQDYNVNTKNQKRKLFKNWGKEYKGKDFIKSEKGTFLKTHYHFVKKRTNGFLSKPKELFEIFISSLCPKEGLVLDLFSGSGTTKEVCEKLNCNFICFERNIESKYVKKVV